MTCGSKVKRPSQVLIATAVQGTVVALLSLYDWIILDAPPTTVYPDVASLGTACGAAMLVIRAESTRPEVAEEAKTVLTGTGVDLLGAVLNRRRFHIPKAIYERL
jgi:Mrp family chromosome partitioning ATPase